MPKITDLESLNNPITGEESIALVQDGTTQVAFVADLPFLKYSDVTLPFDNQGGNSRTIGLETEIAPSGEYHQFRISNDETTSDVFFTVSAGNDDDTVSYISMETPQLFIDVDGDSGNDYQTLTPRGGEIGWYDIGSLNVIKVGSNTTTSATSGTVYTNGLAAGPVGMMLPDSAEVGTVYHIVNDLDEVTQLLYVATESGSTGYFVDSSGDPQTFNDSSEFLQVTHSATILRTSSFAWMVLSGAGLTQVTP